MKRLIAVFTLIIIILGVFMSTLNSTSKTVGKPDPDIFRAAVRGSTTITTTASGSIYQGSSTIDFNYARGDALPHIQVWMYEDLGVPGDRYWPLPFTIFTTAGALSYNLYYNIREGDVSDITGSDELRLVITAQTSGAVTLTLKYIISTMAIDPYTTIGFK